MQDFHPQIIYIDKAVRDLPYTQNILKKFPQLPHVEVNDRFEIKNPQEHTHAKKQLFISKLQGDMVKACQGMGDYVCCLYHTVAFVSDCHLECTYCILQDYLQNNPVITLHANTEEIFDAIRKRAERFSGQTFRIGTGELSDSLALDHITGLSREIVEFASTVPNLVMELKTKTANIDNLLGLSHNKNVVISWSINPQSYIQKEEHKCDTLESRLKAARTCADHGYPVGFHFDPLLYYDNWRSEYDNVIDQLAELFKPEELAWISLGSLRFTPGLKKIANERFPKSKIMTGELYPSQDGKVRYYRPHREELYTFMTNTIEKKIGKVPHYLCMETSTVWKNVYGKLPESNRQLDQYLATNVNQQINSSSFNDLGHVVGWDV